jgi:hypothetical protein
VGTGFAQKQCDHSRPESVFAFQIKGENALGYFSWPEETEK